MTQHGILPSLTGGEGFRGPWFKVFDGRLVLVPPALTNRTAAAAAGDKRILWTVITETANFQPVQYP
jgi:hypothetical protein